MEYDSTSTSSGAGLISGSFRDPSGFLFEQDGVLYRQINKVFQESFDAFCESGLYDKLVKKGLLIPHQRVEDIAPKSEDAYCIIKPERVNFISYPYEWSFSQFKGAALATLDIQKIALECGFTLKDASAYNIQFHNGRPVFIDTLSFEPHTPGEPWVGYKQFCQHFLAPLALMSYRDIRAGLLCRNFIDGVPLDLASRLLPRRTKFRLGLLMHIHMHAKSQMRYADSTKATARSKASISLHSLQAIIANLRNTVSKLQWKLPDTEWGEYYDMTNYNELSFSQKHQIVSDMIKAANPKSLWDLGANTGEFSRLGSSKGIKTVAFDIDPVAVEKNYQLVRKNSEKDILPLIMDLTNPSPAIGWANDERFSVAQRGPADLVMALALIHHLAISNNLPLGKIADYFAQLGLKLIIEFVPKEDSQVQKLLASRKDIFPNYTEEGFIKAFEPFFDIDQQTAIPDTRRTLFLMSRKG